MSSSMFRTKQAKFVKDSKTSGAILLTLLTDEFGTECYDWEPETLQMEIEALWGDIPPTNYEKIMAFLTVLTTNRFENSLEAFIHICNGLVGGGANFKQYDPATVTEMCKTIAEVSLIDPPEKGLYQFNEEIRQYIRKELDFEGYGQIPRLLKPYTADGEEMPEDLPMDEIEANSYFDRQQQRLEILDMEVRAHLQAVFNDLNEVPLRNADQAAKNKLVESYSKIA